MCRAEHVENKRYLLGRLPELTSASVARSRPSKIAHVAILVFRADLQFTVHSTAAACSFRT